MGFNRTKLVAATGVVLLCVSAASAKTSKGKARHSTKSHATASSKAGKSVKSSKTSAKSSHSSRKSAKSARKARGQQAMDSQRASEIQSALIREHYLDGEPSGSWDSRSKAAMQKFQADHGWQSKVVPDSRALIVLGLGPDHSNLMNPDTAATSNLRPGGGVERNNQ